MILFPFITLDTVACSIVKTANEHASLQFSGHIELELEEDYLKKSMSESQVELLSIDEAGETYTLFVGVTRNFRIKKEGTLLLMSLDAVSSSYYMDLTPKTRVFQNTATTYNEILDFLGKSYNNFGKLMSVGDGSQIGSVLVQYHETDWAFMKRMASHFHSVILPAYRKEGFRVLFGYPNGKQDASFGQDEITVRKAVGEYLKKVENDTGSLIESDVTCLEIDSRDIYEIGDSFVFNGQTYYIASIKSNYVGMELVHHYLLKPKGGLNESKIYNEHIIGASLDATITGVSRDTVKVKVNADGIQNPAKWLPYSTVYSSPDGTGWYCMPEKGDSVRLYFPSEREDQGYVISAVHVINTSGSSSSTSDEPRSDPDNKSLKNKDGKEILLTPGLIRVTCNEQTYIEISDEEGIKIISDKPIVIQSKDSIEMASTEGAVTVMAKESIELAQQGTSIKIEDEIHLNGAKVHME